uniref:NADH-ubiquinone oxidoreductase chain 5 n=1 Tax=Trixagus sp. TRI01 TaxID=1205587 RepID=A0A0S2MQC4_9COLE|nr:NADH deshydrogenase subunit 5 [Trixagus sp. TRI01]
MIYLGLMIFWLGVWSFLNESVYVFEYVFSTFNTSYMSFSLIFDWMSLFFLSLVCFISSMVFCYSCGYMVGDKNINRFLILVFLFVFSMLLMILSPSLVSILVGWDGLGLSSYCLIIYYQNVKSYAAGLLTVLMNRLGDVALLISISWMMSYGSWNFYSFSLFGEFTIYIMFFVSLASFTKSAQIPFSSWLPAAMAAPTPVSSLVHSSTLVTAGVYLMIRFTDFLGFSMKFYLLILSISTSLMAGISASYEFDLKKIIALSTLSQLGLMMSVLFIGDSLISFFHLFIHALFKALLFMCAGVLIHCFSSLQDIRYMGNLVSCMPLTICLFNMSNLSLCGIPFMSGFYSKDLILEIFLMSEYNFIIYLMLYLSVGLTVSYSIRLSYYSIYGEGGGFPLSSVNDGNLYFKFSMSVMSLLVIFSGGLLNWMVFSTPLFICLPLILKLMVLTFIMLGSLLGLLFSMINFKFSYMTMYLYGMWNLSDLFTGKLNMNTLKFSDYIHSSFDTGWVEYYGSQNFMNFMILFSNLFIYMLNNSFKIFLSLMVIMLFILILL